MTQRNARYNDSAARAEIEQNLRELNQTSSARTNRGDGALTILLKQRELLLGVVQQVRPTLTRDARDALGFLESYVGKPQGSDLPFSWRMKRVADTENVLTQVRDAIAKIYMDSEEFIACKKALSEVLGFVGQAKDYNTQKSQRSPVPR